MDWPGETWLAHNVSPGSSCSQLLLKNRLLTLSTLPLTVLWDRAYSLQIATVLSNPLFRNKPLSWFLAPPWSPRKHLGVEFSGKYFLDTYIQHLDVSHKYLRSLICAPPHPYSICTAESFNRAKVRNLLCLPFIPSTAICCIHHARCRTRTCGYRGKQNKSPAFLELTCYSEREAVNSYKMKEWNESPDNYYLPLTHLPTLM